MTQANQTYPNFHAGAPSALRFTWRKVWLVEAVEGRASQSHQPLALFEDEGRARDRAEREKPRETVVSWLWLEEREK